MIVVVLFLVIVINQYLTRVCCCFGCFLIDRNWESEWAWIISLKSCVCQLSYSWSVEALGDKHVVIDGFRVCGIIDDCWRGRLHLLSFLLNKQETNRQLLTSERSSPSCGWGSWSFNFNELWIKDVIMFISPPTSPLKSICPWTTPNSSSSSSSELSSESPSGSPLRKSRQSTAPSSGSSSSESTSSSIFSLCSYRIVKN